MQQLVCFSIKLKYSFCFNLLDDVSNVSKSGSLVEVAATDCITVKNADSLAGDGSSNGRSSEQEHENDDEESVYGRMLPGRSHHGEGLWYAPRCYTSWSRFSFDRK